MPFRVKEGVAKTAANQAAVEAGQLGIQLHGGLGVTWEQDIHLYNRRAAVDRAMALCEGDDDSLIVVAGSLFVVGEARGHHLRRLGEAAHVLHARVGVEGGQVVAELDD